MNKAFFSIVAIVLISGCSGGEPIVEKPLTTEGLYGLVISEFSTDFATIEEGDITTLLVELQNVDKESARNVDVKIYPVGLQIPASKQVSNENIIEPNETTFFEFDVTAPSGLNIDRTYTPYAEICYNYLASGSTSVFVIDNAAYDTNTQIPEPQTVTTEGPVFAELSFSRYDVRVEDLESGRNRTLDITLTNVDNGYIMNDDDGFVGDTISGTSDKSEKHKIAAKSLVVIITTTGNAAITTVEDSLNADFACTASTSTTAPSSITGSSSDTTNKVIVKVDGEDVITNQNIFCTNKADVSFGSTGSGKTLRLPINFKPDSGGQDVPYFKADLNYRYCIQTEPISITATKIV